MEMGNIVPRVGIEPTLPALCASVITTTPHRLPWCHHYSHAYLSMQLLSWEWDVSAAYYTCPPRIVSLLILTVTYCNTYSYSYIHTSSYLALQALACRWDSRLLPYMNGGWAWAFVCVWGASQQAFQDTQAGTQLVANQAPTVGRVRMKHPAPIQKTDSM